MRGEGRGGRKEILDVKKGVAKNYAFFPESLKNESIGREEGGKEA